MLMVMDYKSTKFKVSANVFSYHSEMVTIDTPLAAWYCRQENTVVPWKRSAVMKSVHFFVENEVKDAKTPSDNTQQRARGICFLQLHCYQQAHLISQLRMTSFSFSFQIQSKPLIYPVESIQLGNCFSISLYLCFL